MPLGDGKPLGTRDIAELLGVSRNTVHMWHARRAQSGFPEAADQVVIPQYPGDKPGAPLFDPQAVIEWYAGYAPWQGRRKPDLFTEGERRAGHAAYVRGDRDDDTAAKEAEYRRHQKRFYRARKA